MDKNRRVDVSWCQLSADESYWCLQQLLKELKKKTCCECCCCVVCPPEGALLRSAIKTCIMSRDLGGVSKAGPKYSISGYVLFLTMRFEYWGFCLAWAPPPPAMSVTVHLKGKTNEALSCVRARKLSDDSSRVTENTTYKIVFNTTTFNMLIK